MIKTIEYRDPELKSKMKSDGPWQQEPDKKQWEYRGFACLIVRNHSGALCGYVGVTEGHHLFGRDYQEVFGRLDCHGGLTFSGKCQEGPDPARGICHVADEEAWWLGFDCGHAYDYKPSKDLHAFRDHGDQYCDFRYVADQVERLADQIYKDVPNES